METYFIFCHGYGFDDQFWNNMKQYFPVKFSKFLNLGYFNEEDLKFPIDRNIEFVGIGHSMGLIKLLSLGIKFKALIGLQAFINFLGFHDKFQKRQLDNFYKDFLKNPEPEEFLKNFYHKCVFNQIDHPEIFNNLNKIINKKKLRDDLELLYEKYELFENIPILIIGSKNDSIIPFKIIQNNFENKENVKLILLEDSNHSLGYHQSNLIYKIIAEFLIYNHIFRL